MSNEDNNFYSGDLSDEGKEKLGKVGRNRLVADMRSSSTKKILAVIAISLFIILLAVQAHLSNPNTLY